MGRKYQEELDELLAVLLDRKGFDWWWEDIEEEFQEEIQDELHAVLVSFRESLG